MLTCHVSLPSNVRLTRCLCHDGKRSEDFCLKCAAEWRLWFLSRPTQVAVLRLCAPLSIDEGTVDVYVIMAGFKERGSI